MLDIVDFVVCEVHKWVFGSVRLDLAQLYGGIRAVLFREVMRVHGVSRRGWKLEFEV